MEATAEDLTSVAKLLPLSTAEVAALPLLQKPKLHLSHDAHRRWRANSAVDFLNNVWHVDILEAQVSDDRAVQYALQVQFSHPMCRLPRPHGGVKHETLSSATCAAFVVERCFSDFEQLRHDALSVVSALPPCTCPYCLDLLVYLRFKMGQPRGIVKLAAGTEVRKKILVQFMSDLVAMGRRRVEKVGKRECPAQLAIPVLLEEFLLGVVKNGKI